MLSSQKANYRTIGKKLRWKGATLGLFTALCFYNCWYVAYFVNKDFKIELKQKQKYTLHVEIL